jgi:hypothetical protein
LLFGRVSFLVVPPFLTPGHHPRGDGLSLVYTDDGANVEENKRHGAMVL